MKKIQYCIGVDIIGQHIYIYHFVKNENYEVREH